MRLPRPLLLLLALSGCTDPIQSQTHAIIGGQAVGDGELWSTVHITGQDRRLGCGGTLIAPSLVLTAAHCVQNPEVGLRGTPEEVLVGWGTHEVSSGQVPAERSAAVEAVFVHPQYSYEPPGTHDIAVLRLASPIEGQEAAWVPTMAEFQREVAVGSTLTLMGAGLQQEGDSPSEPDGRVHRIDVELNRIDERHISVGARGATACSGDSGGPAYATPMGERWVVGVTSAADERSPQPVSCGGPAQYTLAPYYFDWIQEVSNPRVASDAGTPMADAGIVADAAILEPRMDSGGCSAASGHAPAASSLLLMLFGLRRRRSNG